MLRALAEAGRSWNIVVHDADGSVLFARSPTAKLHDSILRRIWGFLPLVDRTHVARVCQRWRAAALSTNAQAMWSHLDLYYHAHPDMPWSRTNLGALRTALTRSGDEKLHVSFDVRAPNGTGAHARVARYLARALLPHAARLVSLELRPSFLGALLTELARTPGGGGRFQLGDLTVHLRLASGEGEGLSEADITAAASIRSLRLHVSSPQDELLALDRFTQATHPDLTFVYSAVAPVLGLSILTHIPDCLALTCSLTGSDMQTVVLTATRGRDGRKRRLEFPLQYAAHCLPNVWRDLPANTIDAVTSLAVDIHLWSLLTQTHARRLPFLQTLMLVFSTAERHIPAPIIAVPFPVLKRLVLHGPATRIPPEPAIVAFLTSLRLTARLDCFWVFRALASQEDVAALVDPECEVLEDEHHDGRALLRLPGRPDYRIMPR